MIILSLLIAYALAVAACVPYLDAIQRHHYRPWIAPSWRQVAVDIGLLLYECVLLVWHRFLPQSVWLPLYVTVATTPFAVVVGVRLVQVHWRLTHRLERLWGVAALLLGAVYGVLMGVPDGAKVAGLAVVAPYVTVQLAATLLYPIETKRNQRFVRRMSAKLQASGAVVIGITGSAGKTTVKRLVCAALGEHCYATPGNFNTPLGLALAIRAMPSDTRYFVAEMGVGKPGDMAELLQMVRPAVGVVTCVLPQHSAHFDSLESICAEKCALLQAAQWSVCAQEVGYPANATFGEGGDWWADGVQLHRQSTEFVVHHQGETCAITLPLCGRQSVANALCAYAVAWHLGVTSPQIVDRWRAVAPEPHRLVPMCNQAGVWIVDDSYNCNIRGAGYALEYLRLYPQRKIVATSGIEESDSALALNRELGAMVAQVADIVVIVGDRHRQELMEGVQSACKVYCVPSTAESVRLYARLLQQGDVLLIMADYRP